MVDLYRSTSTITLSTSTTTTSTTTLTTSTSTFTSKVTATSTVTSVVQTNVVINAKRDVPTPLPRASVISSNLARRALSSPTYASACATTQYSSACSCLIGSAPTTTLPGPTVYVTVTPNATVTSTLTLTSVAKGPSTVITATTTTTTTTLTSINSETAAPSSFILQVNGGAANGQYVYGNSDGNFETFTSTRSSATKFSLDGTQRLVTSTGLVVNTNTASDGGTYFVYVNGANELSGYVPFTCAVTYFVGAPLLCTAQDKTMFYSCTDIGYSLFFSNGNGLFGDCAAIALEVLAP